MKQFLILTVILSMCFLLNAQDADLVITGTKKVSKKETPEKVIAALNAKFPDAKSVKYYKTTPETVKNGWEVTTEDNLGGADVEYYTISFKRDDMKYYGLYNRDGDLVQSRAEAKVATLPDPVVASLKSISSQYPGYKVTSKTYYKNQNYSKSKEYYEVTASNGKDTKRLYYAPDGTLTKIKE